jgi:endothelin-converting enzyme
MFDLSLTTRDFSELSHAFDNNGAEYDETGRLRNWWTKQTKDSFDQKTSCFVDQYGKYTVTGPDDVTLHVNGKLTLGENVADAGGLHAAFKSWDKRGRPGKIMPILADFTKEQTFFLSYANAWCGFSTPEAAAQGIYRDPHSPPGIRILVSSSTHMVGLKRADNKQGTTSNSAAFREAFNCPIEKPTCELW